ncbi:hypothetical protein EVAR_66120_1 [Eumeta japonica]|uniref:Uncharacterized protein n=1 Tax=Eumeta variegata TaxID=151549 RepID=A0A4C1ZTI3_EUMVA|nr:hypothetical protein EVAR_66120_1 [Eumeta japonica]
MDAVGTRPRLTGYVAGDRRRALASTICNPPQVKQLHQWRQPHSRAARESAALNYGFTVICQRDACRQHALTCSMQPTTDPRISSSTTNPYQRMEYGLVVEEQIRGNYQPNRLIDAGVTSQSELQPARRTHQRRAATSGHTHAIFKKHGGYLKCCQANDDARTRRS